MITYTFGIVFGDQAWVNMQEMALMQAGRDTGKG